MRAKAATKPGGAINAFTSQRPAAQDSAGPAETFITPPATAAVDISESHTAPPFPRCRSENDFTLAHSRASGVSYNAAQHAVMHHPDARSRARSSSNLPSAGCAATDERGAWHSSHTTEHRALPAQSTSMPTPMAALQGGGCLQRGGGGAKSESVAAPALHQAPPRLSSLPSSVSSARKEEIAAKQVGRSPSFTHVLVTDWQ